MALPKSLARSIVKNPNNNEASKVTASNEIVNSHKNDAVPVEATVLKMACDIVKEDINVVETNRISREDIESAKAAATLAVQKAEAVKNAADKVLEAANAAITKASKAETEAKAIFDSTAKAAAQLEAGNAKTQANLAKTSAELEVKAADQAVLDAGLALQNAKNAAKADKVIDAIRLADDAKISAGNIGTNVQGIVLNLDNVMKQIKNSDANAQSAIEAAAADKENSSKLINEFIENIKAIRANAEENKTKIEKEMNEAKQSADEAQQVVNVATTELTKIKDTTKYGVAQGFLANAQTAATAANTQYLLSKTAFEDLEKAIKAIGEELEIAETAKTTIDAPAARGADSAAQGFASTIVLTLLPKAVKAKDEAGKQLTKTKTEAGEASKTVVQIKESIATNTKHIGELVALHKQAHDLIPVGKKAEQVESTFKDVENYWVNQVSIEQLEASSVQLKDDTELAVTSTLTSIITSAEMNDITDLLTNYKLIVNDNAKTTIEGILNPYVTSSKIALADKNAILGNVDLIKQNNIDIGTAKLDSATFRSNFEGQCATNVTSAVITPLQTVSDAYDSLTNKVGGTLFSVFDYAVTTLCGAINASIGTALPTPSADEVTKFKEMKDLLVSYLPEISGDACNTKVKKIDPTISATDPCAIASSGAAISDITEIKPLRTTIYQAIEAVKSDLGLNGTAIGEHGFTKNLMKPHCIDTANAGEFMCSNQFDFITDYWAEVYGYMVADGLTI